MPSTSTSEDTEMTGIEAKAHAKVKAGNTIDIEIMVEIVSTEEDTGTMMGTRTAAGGDRTRNTGPEHHQTPEKDASTIRHPHPRIDTILIGPTMGEGVDHPLLDAIVPRTVIEAGKDRFELIDDSKIRTAGRNYCQTTHCRHP